MEMTKAEGKEKFSQVRLIRQFFNPTLQEVKELSVLDKLQLASGIARNCNIPASECDFEFVAY